MSNVQLREWDELRVELEQVASEDALGKHIVDRLLCQDRFDSALAVLLADRLANGETGANHYLPVIEHAYARCPALIHTAVLDLDAIKARDPAIVRAGVAFLFSKGFHALEAYRVAHHYWRDGRQAVALALSHACSRSMGVDIHPAAKIGVSVMLDHASGIVVGETAEIGDGVTLLHGVTLGGNGRARVDRHPKIGSGAFIGAHASIIGSIRVGNNSVIGAGAVVVSDVPENSVAVGVPAKAKPVNRKSNFEVDAVQAIAGITGSPVLAD